MKVALLILLPHLLLLLLPYLGSVGAVSSSTGFLLTDPSFRTTKPTEPSPAVTARTSFGVVHGLVGKQGCRGWKGIPYAPRPQRFGPPTRWAQPFPAEGLNATGYGAWCPQDEGGTVDGNETCLFMNIWAPPAASHAAVMAWIYGGDFINGDGGDSASLNTYDGCALAATQGVVVASFNYRVGPLGWATLQGNHSEDSISANWGMQDQLEALRWLQREVHGFGGDASKVTIFGESAGAISTFNLVASPAAHGLFRGAISQSGLPSASSLAYGLARTTAWARRVSCTGQGAALLTCLRGRSVDELIQAAEEDPSTPGWGPTVGTHEVPEMPGLAFARGRINPSVALLAGFNTNEGNAFVWPGRPTAMNVSAYRSLMAILLRRKDPATNLNDTQFDQVLAQYPCETSDCRAVAGTLLTDYIFRCKTLLTAAQHRAPAFVYRFNHVSSFMHSTAPGVLHGDELPYPFGTDWSYRDQDPTAAFTAEEQALSNRMQAMWANFAKVQAPGSAFPQYTENPGQAARNLVLQVPRDTIEQGSGIGACQLWEEIWTWQYREKP